MVGGVEEPFPSSYPGRKPSPHILGGIPVLLRSRTSILPSTEETIRTETLRPDRFRKPGFHSRRPNKECGRGPSPGYCHRDTGRHRRVSPEEDPKDNRRDEYRHDTDDRRGAPRLLGYGRGIPKTRTRPRGCVVGPQTLTTILIPSVLSF